MEPENCHKPITRCGGAQKTNTLPRVYKKTLVKRVFYRFMIKNKEYNFTRTRAQPNKGSAVLHGAGLIQWNLGQCHMDQGSSNMCAISGIRAQSMNNM